MLFSEIDRLPLAHTPTPLWHNRSLDALVGAEVWVKRDDMNAGAEAGNKIRKLEYLLAAAQSRRADTVVTCGAAQSNHARATALCCAQLGLQCHLMLRTTDASSETVVGNLYLDKLCGAHIHWVSPEQYAEREQRMKEIAEDLDRAGRCVFIIPEGGSNALGSLGYVRAMREVREQLSSAQGERAETLPESFDAIVHACGSGGTAAGVGIGAAACQIAEQLHAVAVCDNTQYFEGIIAALRSDMKDLASDLPPSIPTRVHDQFMGPGYGISSPEQLSFLQQVACRTGLVLDPVYSGKALYALAKDQAHMKVRGQRILFIHTGGLPGLLAQASTP